jgi:iron complex outermembrane recepter protein
MNRATCVRPSRLLWGCLALAAATPAGYAQTLEVVIVTAQRRETALQTTPIAISAYTGESLAEDKVFTVTDLANSVPAFSLTAGSPLDAELNIRGITNTRLDAPSADPSVGTFVDGIYMGRTGDMNYDFYDLDHIEVIRGPQGVLLGKNVVGGALSVSTAKPEFETSGKVLASYGNYNSMLASGYLTGGLTKGLAGRFSFHVRRHDGYARDVLHHRDVEDLDSKQGRAQLLYAPEDSTWKARLIVDFNKDDTNGINVVPVDGGTPSCETSYLRTNCARPWSNLRRYLGLTNPRQDVAQSVQYAGDSTPTQQFMERKGVGIVLDVQKDFGGFAFNSLTGYRDADADQLYDQTGIGPESLGWSVAAWQSYVAFVAATRPVGNTSNGLLLFAEPVAEKTKIKQFSQEFRLTSTSDSRLDWIAGVYFKSDDIDKTDRFIGENFLGSLPPPGGLGLRTLSGETRWVNNGKNETYAGFGQLGFKFTERLKFSAGVRYTHDKKEGNVSGFAVATGDRFNPNDAAALTPLLAFNPLTGTGYRQGTGYDTPYGKQWSKVTPQGILEFTQSDNLFLYASVAKGFKGGGFDDTPASDVAARIPFDPEEVTNYEVGFKTDLLDRRMRLNASIFYMDYTDLQVTQTNAACLCNLTDNAASAEIKGIESEFQFAITRGARIFLSGSYVDTKYVDFLESALNPSTGQRLDSSGNRLQRTPETQVSGGFDITASIGNWQDALNVRVNYSWQSDLFWATDNIAKEDPYGLLDARVAFGPPDANWQVALWGKNLTDELYRVNIIPFFGEEASQFGMPRTYGIDLSWEF